MFNPFRQAGGRIRVRPRVALLTFAPAPGRFTRIRDGTAVQACEVQPGESGPAEIP